MNAVAESSEISPEASGLKISPFSKNPKNPLALERLVAAASRSPSMSDALRLSWSEVRGFASLKNSAFAYRRVCFALSFNV